MPGIDWTYLGSIGGEGLEDFAATCLCQRHPDARQTRPASGDGGIDVVRETAEGLVVWQVKRFTTPLTSGQRSQVRRSWERFWDTHVRPGHQVAEYHLVTPWTPTDSAYEWFRDDLCGEAMFTVRWDGAAFWNGLAADYPATFDRFTKGSEMLEQMVLAKAALASSPVETADTQGMVDALARRDAALDEIRGLVSDHYHLDTGTRSGRPDGDMPLPAPGEAGVYHRYTHLGDNRWYVQSVVPKTSLAGELDPMSLELRFLVEPGSDEERVVEAWRAWGIPFRDLPAETRHQGGPLHEDQPSRGTISFVPVEQHRVYPPLMLTVVGEETAADGSTSIVFATEEVNRAVEGRGLRVRGLSPSGVLEVDVRVGAEAAPDRLEIRLLDTDGTEPRLLRDELLALVSASGEGRGFRLDIDGKLPVAAGTDLRPPPAAELAAELADALLELQPHTVDRLVMPSLDGITDEQLRYLQFLVVRYGGTALETTWERQIVTVKDPASIRSVPLDGTGHLVYTQQPAFRLGNREYRITRLLATTYCTPILAPGVDRDRLSPGQEIELVAGEDNRLVVAAVADSTAEAPWGEAAS
jgi:hypothetical protein